MDGARSRTAGVRALPSARVILCQTSSGEGLPHRQTGRTPSRANASTKGAYPPRADFSECPGNRHEEASAASRVDWRFGRSASSPFQLGPERPVSDARQPRDLNKANDLLAGGRSGAGSRRTVPAVPRLGEFHLTARHSHGARRHEPRTALPPERPAGPRSGLRAVRCDDQSAAVLAPVAGLRTRSLRLPP
jgi:hypothetical protein